MYQFTLPLLPQPKDSRKAGPRHGLVLVAVLIVTVLLSLAAWTYTHWALKEYGATVTRVREAQAKAAADSAIHYFMAMMADPEDSSTLLNGNWYDNMQAFQDITLVANDNLQYQSAFSILTPRIGDSVGAMGPCRGVIAESQKINLNAYMALDPSGTTLYNALMLLPNMTDPIANSICYWLDPTQTERSSGADLTYYLSLSPPYPPQSGDLHSMEELLLVQGVMGNYLYGDDLNRNGIQESNETITDPTGYFGSGWMDWLTIYAHEPNISAVTGAPRVFLNDTVDPMSTQLANLSAIIDSDLATFILMARLNTDGNGGTYSGLQSYPSTGPTPLMAGQQAGTVGSLNIDWTTVTPSNTIPSVFALVNSYITVTTTTPPTGGGKGPPQVTTTVYQSPLNDSSELAVQLPLLLDQTTAGLFTMQGTKMTTNTAVNPSEILGRVNINTAGFQVLTALSYPNGNPLFQPTDVANIQSNQPIYASSEAPDPSFNTVTWLMTTCNFTAQQMQQFEPFITTYSQAYRFQAIGYFDGGGPWRRVEVVVDLNPQPSITGMPTYFPRIVYYRDSEQKLGPGWDMQNLQGF